MAAGNAPRGKSDRWAHARLRSSEVGLWLERRIWQQLDRIGRIFHVLPVIAALTIVGLLALDGQLREIYLTYLEELQSKPVAACMAIAFAIAALALLSALLFQAHYWLSRLRGADPVAGAMVQWVQGTAAMLLALSPWFGLAAGLFGAELYLYGLNGSFNDMHDFTARVPDIRHYLPTPNVWSVAIAATLLGVTNTVFVNLHWENGLLRNVIVLTTPTMTVCMFLLLTDFFPTAYEATRNVFVGRLEKEHLQIAAILAWIVGGTLITVGYYVIYHRLYLKGLYFDPSTRGQTPIFQGYRPTLMFVWLFLPWVLIALYFIGMGTHALPKSVTQQNSWAAIPIAMSAVIVVGLMVTQLLDHCRKRGHAPGREGVELQRLIIVIVVLLVVASRVFFFLAGSESVVSVYRVIGPLGTTALELLFLLATCVLLAWLSQKSGFPVLSLVVLTTIIIVLAPIPVFWSAILMALCLVVGITALLSGLYPVAAAAAVLAAAALIIVGEARTVETVSLNPPENSVTNQQPVNVSDNSVCQRFENWLKEKTWRDQKTWPAEKKTAAAKTSNHVPCPRPGTAANQNTSHGTVAETMGNDKAVRRRAYIIAVEGGGIYAASAASLILARLQDAAPNFSDHVFAISGVSGGAIGATVFAALERQTTTNQPLQAQSAACSYETSATAPSTTTLCEEVATIMEDDHYSPVIGSIFPEILAAGTGRAEALAASFARSVQERGPVAAATVCGSFISYWSENIGLPALVLNATWAETGSRTAFAPFPLNDIDESLYSFTDRRMPPLETVVPASATQPAPGCTQSSSISLINAAVVSARFPGILPPFSLSVDAPPLPDSNEPRRLRWNIVDGGYSDNSGAATALALYQALKGIAEEHDVELQVILVTSVNPDLDPTTVSGTAFRDTLAPVHAVLEVRSGASMASVARACDFFYKDKAPGANAQAKKKPCQDHAGVSTDDLQIIQIEDKTYGLSLGWELSHTTFNVISWMLGSIQSNPTDPCSQYSDPIKYPHPDPDPNPYTRDLRDRARSYERNSCVLSSIVDSLRTEQSRQH